ncbi:exo-alpha-sialidase [bacterium]|nr:exo-alpha-sialidase [bacterium]
MHWHTHGLAAGLLWLFAVGALGGALFEDVHPIKWPKGTHGYRGNMGDFLVRKDGSIWMSFTKDHSIVAIETKDKGKTWGEQFTLVPAPKPPAKGRYAHPSFLRLANGEVLLAYIYSTHPATPYYAHNYVRRSADDGRTWTEQFVLTPHAGYVLIHNDRLFAMKSGRLIAMAEVKAHFPSSRDHNGYAGLAFTSDDQGHSWWPSRNLVDMMPIEVQEAGGVELKDGRLLMFARTYSGHPVRAWSSDGGETWTKGEEIKELPMPYAGLPTVKRIPSTGDLLFIWISERSARKDNPKVRYRCALAAALSRDEGKTFGPLRYIARDPDDDFGYQCVEFLGDGLVLVGYHARDGLHVARIGVEWFYGK